MSGCSSWASCLNLFEFACTHFCTSSMKGFAKWRSVVAAASFAVQAPQPPPPARCSKPKLQGEHDRSEQVQFSSNSVRNENRPSQAEMPGPPKARCDQVSFALNFVLARCFLPSSGLAATAARTTSSAPELRGCDVADVLPIVCDRLASVVPSDRRIVRHGVPVEVSSKNVRLGSFAIVFVT